MRVAIVGAGVSGLASARVFRAVGLDVVVYEARRDLGGVWSATRRYPGLSTQNDKRSYAFSDMAMPDGFPTCPTSRDVQEYLSGYARHHGLEGSICFSTTVESAAPLPGDSGWTLDLVGPDGRREEHADWLVAANGLFSRPHLPDLPGLTDFEGSGGRMLAPSEVGDGSVFEGRDLLILGWGKSAADIAVAAVDGAASVTLVARKVGWKLPHRIGRFTWQHLVRTRAGEFLLWAPRRRSVALWTVMKPFSLLRPALLGRVEQVIVRQQELRRRALVPDEGVGTFTHLATPGFFEAVDRGEIRVLRDARVASFGPRAATLTTGSTVPCDVVVAATGFDQPLDFLHEDARRRLVDADGDLQLFRQTLPETVGRLAFAGWHLSFHSPVAAEVQAMWIASVIHGRDRRAAAAARRRFTSVYRLTHERAERRGQPLFTGVGATMPVLDDWIRLAGLRLPMTVRTREWFRPLDPASYAGLLPQLQRRVGHRPLGPDGSP